MRTRLTRLGVTLAAVAALAVGGSALASAASKSPTVNPPAPAGVTAAAETTPESNAIDGDNVQQGDQSSPDVAGSPAESSSESASETGPSDGPGGYADTNPNADTQQEGQN